MPETEVILLVVAALAILTWWVYSSHYKSQEESQLKHVDSLMQAAQEQRRKGDFEQQAYLLQKALETLEAQSNCDFSRQSSCLINLADCLQKQGQYNRARESYAKLLSLWQQKLDAREGLELADFDYFCATSEFGAATVDVAEFYKNVIDLKKKIYGEQHSEVANSLTVYSGLLLKLGEKQQAEAAKAQADVIRKLAEATKKGDAQI